MQALGLIETKGLVAAVESADAMLKAADVRLLEKTIVGGGLVSVTVTGDVAAVKASVDAGAAAVQKLGGALLVSQHVIPRPHPDLDLLIGGEPADPAAEPEAVDEDAGQEPEPVVIAAQPAEAFAEDPDETRRACIDKMVLDYGLEEALDMLGKLKVVKLRNLAREYKDFGITGRAISKADKQMILAEFRNYYGQA